MSLIGIWRIAPWAVTAVALAASLIVLVAVGRIAARQTWSNTEPAATSTAISYSRTDTRDPNLVVECMHAGAQLVSCSGYRRHTQPHILLVRVVDGSVALTVPLSEVGLKADQTIFVTNVAFGSVRDTVPITFDGGFAQIHLTKTQIETVVSQEIKVGNVGLPLVLVAELYNVTMEAMKP